MTDQSTTSEGRMPIMAGVSFDAAIASKMLTQFGHGGWLGMHYHAHGDGWLELALPWREDLIGIAGSGVLASGPIISLMDNATSMAVWARRGPFTPQVTVDLRVDYMRAATPGKTLIGRGECYKLTRSIAFVRGLAHDGDINDPVAHVAGTFMVMEVAAG